MARAMRIKSSFAGAALLALVACSGASGSAGLRSTSSPAISSPPSPSPIGAAPSSSRAGDGCKDIESDLLLTRTLAESLRKDEAGSKKWNDAHTQMLTEFSNVGDAEIKVRIDLQLHGPYPGGDRCLSRIAGAENSIGLALGETGEGDETESAALTYELLITYYPASPEASKAKRYLRDHGYPIATAAPT